MSKFFFGTRLMLIIAIVFNTGIGIFTFFWGTLKWLSLISAACVGGLVVAGYFTWAKARAFDKTMRRKKELEAEVESTLKKLRKREKETPESN